MEQFCDAGGDIVTCHVEADTEENIHEALRRIHAGANVLVAGSAVYKAEDIPQRIKELRG